MAFLALLANIDGSYAQQRPIPPGPDNLFLSCTGAFARDANAERLRQVFGPANVRNQSISAGEGETEPGTILFPNDPARRVEILWHDERRLARPRLITIRAAPRVASLWRGPGGLHAGSSLTEFESVNGRPFALDYTLTVNDWKGGVLSSHSQGCRFVAAFEPDPNASQAALIRAQRQADILSNDRNLRAIRRRLVSIHLQHDDAPTRH